jgi:hypothetical protein
MYQSQIIFLLSFKSTFLLFLKAEISFGKEDDHYIGSDSKDVINLGHKL